MPYLGLATSKWGVSRNCVSRSFAKTRTTRIDFPAPATLFPRAREGYRNRTILPHELDTTLVQGRLNDFVAPTIELVSRAANWICVGETVGRGRNDRYTQKRLPIKAVYLYPLAKDFRKRCQSL